MLRRAGLARGPGAVEAAYERCGAAMTERFWSHHRDCSIEEQVRLLFECVEPGLSDWLGAELLDQAVEGYATPVLRWPPALQPGAAAAIRALAARGVKLGIVSNTGRTPGVMLRRLLDGHGLLGCFTAVSYSDEIGVRKPSAEIFRLTLAALGVAPGFAVHVGDSPEADVRGARAAGMRAVHYAADGRVPAPEADLVVTSLADLPIRLEAWS